MKTLTFILASALAVGCTSTALSPVAVAAEHPEAKPFAAKANARADVDAALAEAIAQDKLGMIVMGANWCHDSRALAGWFETPRFQTLLDENYVVSYVDVGQKDRNLDIARAFGLDGIAGTPTVVIVDAAGMVLNLDTAPTWRNSASRSEDAIFDEFAAHAGAAP